MGWSAFVDASPLTTPSGVLNVVSSAFNSLPPGVVVLAAAVGGVALVGLGVSYLWRIFRRAAA